jgi:hypothetical protein
LIYSSSIKEVLTYMRITPQELILSTKLNLRLIDLDLSPELMGPIRKIIIYAHTIPCNSVRIWVLRVNNPVRYSSTGSRHATVLL